MNLEEKRIDEKRREGKRKSSRPKILNKLFRGHYNAERHRK